MPFPFKSPLEWTTDKDFPPHFYPHGGVFRSSEHAESHIGIFIGVFSCLERPTRVMSSFVSSTYFLAGVDFCKAAVDLGSINNRYQLFLLSYCHVECYVLAYVLVCA